MKMGKEVRCLGCMRLYNDTYDVCPYCGYENNQETVALLHMDPGTVLQGRYLIGRALGTGGFGVTYLGYDTKLDRKIAVKEYLPSEFATRMLHKEEILVSNSGKSLQLFERGRDRFLQEARKLAQLGDVDGIVHIFDSFEANNTAYIVMEYLDGETLEDHLQRVGTLPEEQALEMIVPILKTLDEVHSHGILHRDIAPDNIFLVPGEDGRLHVKLIDFGASRFAATTHSKSVTMLIKPGYSSAEQYQSNGEQGTFTDVYSVGAVLYRMLTGQVPADAFERRTQVQNGKRDPLKEPSDICRDISEVVENAVMNALSIRAEDRTPTAGEFLAELQSDTPAKRRVSSVRKIDFLKWPLWAKIGVPAAAAAVISLIVLLACGVIGFNFAEKNFALPDGMCYVPDVVNYDIDDVTSWVEDAELVMYNAGGSYAPGTPENIVLTQDVPAGSVVMKNTRISVTVSTGKEKYLMPDVTGMTQEAATAAIACMGVQVSATEATQPGLAAGCVSTQSVNPYEEIQTGDVVELGVVPGDQANAAAAPLLAGLTYQQALETASAAGAAITVETKQFAQGCAEPTVVSQDPVEGAPLEGGIVTVTLEIPWHEFSMPNLLFKTEEDVLQLLQNIGVVADIEHETNEMVAAGLVASQSVDKDTPVRPGDTVTVGVSTGGKPFAMPSVVGASEESALKELRAAGLSVSVEYKYDSSVAEGNVISQSVAAGEDVTRGTDVTIVVCSHENTVTVSDVVGMERSAAEETLRAQGFKVSVNYVESTSASKGQVLSMIPTAGTEQRQGANIIITVGKGGKASPTDTSHDQADDHRPSQPGPWSDWTTSLPGGVSADSGFDVEEKTQYSYRDKETTTSNTELSGWTLDNTTYSWSDWGSWSGWSPYSPGGSSASREVDTRTTYEYCYFQCAYCGNHWHGYGFPCYTWGGGCGQGTIQEGSWHEVWGTIPQSEINWQDWHGTGHTYTIYNGERVFRNINEPNASRTEYRYRDRQEIPTYHYSRWGNWSSYSDNHVSSSSNRQVRTQTVYRYRTR